MLEALIAELMPESALERELVERIVSILWRLRRVPAFEAALMAWLRKCEEEDAAHDAIYAVGRGDNRNQLMLGRTIQTFLKSDFSGKLGRHETALQRQLSAFIIELREIQARRKHASESQDALPAPK